MMDSPDPPTEKLRRWVVLAIIFVMIIYAVLELLFVWAVNVSDNFSTSLQPPDEPLFFIIEGVLFGIFIVLGLWDWFYSSGEWYRKQTIFPLPHGNSIADEETMNPPPPEAKDAETTDPEP
jgi:hypothetical protein